MKIECLTVGMFQEHTYFAIDEVSKNTFIIDPGADASRILKKIEEEDLKVKGILITHGHFDHIGAVLALKEKLGCKVIAHEEGKLYLGNADYNLSGNFGAAAITFEADHYVKAGECVQLEESGTAFKVVFAPGHTLDGVAYYSEKDKVAFVGDIIFNGSIGRCDLPGGDQLKLLNAIKKEIFTLPEDTVLYPGHGDATTVGKEKATNPFFNIYN